MLAIGLVVDDAIIVVEAVERHIEEGLSPKEAALKAMEEVAGPVMAIALILAAVFIPTVFIPGITGRLYQQFAVTIAISVLISAFNASDPEPGALRPPAQAEERARGPSGCLLRVVQPLFGRATKGMSVFAGTLIRKSALSLLFLAGITILSGRHRQGDSHGIPAGGRSGIHVYQRLVCPMPPLFSAPTRPAKRSRRSSEDARVSNTIRPSSASAC